MSTTPIPPAAPAPRKRWTFLRSFRWAIYLSFFALNVFLAVCLVLGIVGNLKDRGPVLDLPEDRPGSLAEMNTLHLRECLRALEQIRSEQQEHVQTAFAGPTDRDRFLSDFNAWSRDWRRTFEQLGISCRLTETTYDGHPIQGTLAEIYQRIDTLQRQHYRLARRYVTENSRTLGELAGLFERAKHQIERAEGEGARPTP